jgi:hypothetical protein
LQSFADGFDRLLAIGPHEIQLGILKRLRGTPITRHTQAHGMAYTLEPPYTVQQTAAVDANTLHRFVRFSRYWDLLANSGRFAQTLVLVLQQLPEPSPFWRFMGLSDWLSQHLGRTHQLTPEVLVDALHDYLCGQLPPDAVRKTLLADYVASGARASPKALRGVLPRQAPSPLKAVHALSTRQSRHRTNATD